MVPLTALARAESQMNACISISKMELILLECTTYHTGNNNKKPTWDF